MWFVIDPESKQKLGGRFDTQKDLAEFLGISSQSLSRELQLCRLIFRWKGRNVQVVNQNLARYEIQTPDGYPFGKAGTKAELARILGVSRQAVSAAISRPRLDDLKIKGYIVKQRFEKEKITTPCKLGENEKPKPKRNKAVLVASEKSEKFFPSMAQAAKELGVDSKTISSALKHGNHFRRRSDGMDFKVKMAPNPTLADLPEKRIKRKPRAPNKAV